MKFTVEDASTVKKILHIEVPQNDVVTEIDNAYKELSKTSKIKGFRPGKAPRTVLERLYKKDVHQDVRSRLINSSFADALEQSGISPLRLPDIDSPELVTDKDYCFSAAIETKPDIPHIDFKGLTLQKSLYQPSDDEIDAQLKMLQKNLSERRPIEPQRACQDGDFVMIDYEGFQQGAPHPQLQKTVNFTLKIGTSKITREFDDHIIGMMPGEDKEFMITFPENHINADLSGQEVNFQVHLQEVREEVLPEINDDFAKKLGVDSLDNIKAAIRNDLKQGYDKRSEQEINEQIFSALIEKTPFELPDTLVDFELAAIIREIERSYEYHQYDMAAHGVTRESLAATYRETAEKQARRHLILGKIIEQENLTVPDAELDKALQDMAIAYRKPVEEIKAHYDKNQAELDYFKHALLEKQAMKLIIESGTMEEITPVRVDQPDSSPE